MLGWMNGNTLKYRISNDYNHKKLNITLIEDNTRRVDIKGEGISGGD